jgi:hypothetical protein
MSFEWENITDDALIEEVRRRGFTIRDAQISSKRWVGLTEDDILELNRKYYPRTFEVMIATEEKLKEKNT